MRNPNINGLVMATPTDELSHLIGQLEAAKAQALARLCTPGTLVEPHSQADRLLTMPQVADRLGITVHQAREMGRRGELPVIVVGERFVRVRGRSLEEWIRRRESATLRCAGGR
jgi:predicted DNA-binding transcriptional regulator AlpA